MFRDTDDAGELVMGVEEERELSSFLCHTAVVHDDVTEGSSSEANVDGAEKLKKWMSTLYYRHANEN